MAVQTITTKGAYRTLELSVICSSEKRRNGTSPLIIANHGRGGDATQFGPTYYNGTWPTVEALCEAGYVVMSIDGGNTLVNWGNADTMTAIGAAITWAQNSATVGEWYPRAKTGSVGMLGWSMGGLASLNYTVRNQSQVAGAFLFAPVVDLDAAQANATWTTEINTAYGGNYAANATTYDPQDRAADFNAGPPIYIQNSSGDTTPGATPAQHATFDAGTTAVTIHTTAVDHGHFPFLDSGTPDRVVNFFRGVLPP